MKRSRGLILTSMVRGVNRPLGRTALLAGTAMVLTACGDEPMSDVSMFRDVEQCVATNLFDREACSAMQADALASHQSQAPRYDEQALCEAEFGLNGCTFVGQAAETEEGGSTSGFWMPFFAGWVAGNVVDEVGDALEKKKKKKAYGYAQPLYRMTSGGRSTWVTPTGGTLYQGKNGLQMQARSLAAAPSATSAPKVMTRTTVSSRGGFAGSRGFGGFGG